uniref:Uncharacterized protein n=1 Tax=uncultured marine group II/III euryarchaeote AD1000_20_C05 TaxID=1457735 RepID=A0A075FRY9_9EURY|nr:hypothetical protein [uncultured marine group II/III euryarchaeote AD1000_20_C05]
MSLPCELSHLSDLLDRLDTDQRDQNSGPARSLVPSSATALAPFSQNSKAVRWSSGSGHAHPGQSKPSKRFTLDRLETDFSAPILLRPCDMVENTAGIPAATRLGGETFGAPDFTGVLASTSLLTHSGRWSITSGSR